MISDTVHVAVYDTLADWEVGHATAHIRNPNWQRRPGRYDVAYVGATREPVTTMGGLRIVPDLTLAELDPRDSAMLILPGSDLALTPAFAPFAKAARRFLDAGTRVAAICGATGGLAAAGVLDAYRHTSNARDFLAAIDGYHGGERYVDDALAVTDGLLITGSGVAPVDFAREVLAALEVYEPSVLRSWVKLYGDHDPAGYFELMTAA